MTSTDTLADRPTTKPRLVKFSSQLSEAAVAKLRRIAAERGCHIQRVLEAAVEDYTTQPKPQAERIRPAVALAYRQSVAEFDELYALLAK